MKLKKLIYILLILALLPSAVCAEEYPYLPTMLKEKLISVFNINTAGKTMLYERVNIYGDFDAWMIGWFDEQQKIVTGITDTEDIIYYNISQFNELTGSAPTQEISPADGERIASEFLHKIMPETELKLVSSGAYEYTFSQTHNGIRLLGRDATVVVDKFTGQVVYYKGFGQTDSSFEIMEQLVTPEHAFENFYEKIGLELVYDTVYDHNARMKTVRPMYILNRNNLSAVDAQSGEIKDIVMHDYNYYYNDSFYDERFYHDNNIYTEEKVFIEDGTVSASGYNTKNLLDMPYIELTDDYSTKVTPGRLSYYSDANGTQNTIPALRIDIVPLKYAVNILKFSAMFDEGNIEWFNTVQCDTPVVFARAYVEAESGRLLDYETVKNLEYTPENNPYFNINRANGFIKTVAGDISLKFYSTIQINDREHMVTYARYADGVRVIGEGACVIYDETLRAVTDYSVIITNNQLMPVSFMQTKEQIKESVKNEMSLGLFYADKDANTKFVIYDAVDKSIAFDPMTGTRLDRLSENGDSFIGSCSVGSEEYNVGNISFAARPPVIFSGKLFLPAQVISSLLGYEIEQRENELSLTNGRDVINLMLENKSCEVNGERLELDMPPVNISGSTYLSAQSLKALFGMFVSWDADTNIIQIVR